MHDLDTFSRMYAYSDWANARILTAAEPLTDAQLDTPQDIGPKPGSLRRILIHISAGERTWLARWINLHQPKWPDETQPRSLASLRDELQTVARERAAFLTTLSPSRLAALQPYRDSRGSVFQATLADMLLQGFVHSAHHRAQAVNALRRLGIEGVEIDYMNHVRVPAPA